MIEAIDLSGIVLARLRPAHLLLSLPCALEKCMRRTGNSMFDLKRKVVAVAIGCFLSAGAFAQKREERPPKPPNTVVVAPKGERPSPPPNNNNRGDKKTEDKKGKN